jgi:hypothetical protein
MRSDQGCGVAQIGCGVAQRKCGVAQIGCDVAQIALRRPAVRQPGFDSRPGTPLEIPLLSVSGGSDKEKSQKTEP